MSSKGNIIFGCVADDFTGASDAASFLPPGGMKTLLLTEVPDDSFCLDEKYDAVVIAMKIRTVPVKEAVCESRRAFRWLVGHGAKTLYYKYCSTFDSTKEGNIGPVLDSLLEDYGEKYTIICPALPVNGRTVIDGKLYVNGIELHETHMKNHPLTPMWDSDLTKLMKPQSKYPCFKFTEEMLEGDRATALGYIEKLSAENEKFYLAPDYSADAHGEKIAEYFGGLRILSGGSGILCPVAKKLKGGAVKEDNELGNAANRRSIILAGSCSVATLGQIKNFIENGGVSLKIEPDKLISGEQTADKLWDFVENHPDEPVLLYSSDEPERVKKYQEIGKEKVSELLEGTVAELGRRAGENNFRSIIVAGGETSGAVTLALGNFAYEIGENVAPGVPVLIPYNNKEVRLVLKSGNFGDEKFFEKALDITMR